MCFESRTDSLSSPEMLKHITTTISEGCGSSLDNLNDLTLHPAMTLVVGLKADYRALRGMMCLKQCVSFLLLPNQSLKGIAHLQLCHQERILHDGPPHAGKDPHVLLPRSCPCQCGGGASVFLVQ